MAAAPDQLAALRAVFSNPDRTPGLTCAVCTTPAVGSGFRVCYPCNSHLQSAHRVADVVAPITYAVEGNQAMRDLYNYKSAAGGQLQIAARDRLFNGLYLSLSEHMRCFGGIDAVVTVPSSSGRTGAHPVDEMRRMFGDGFEHISVDYVGPARLDRQQRRVLAPERFAVDASSVIDRRVLLLDDAWVTGAHMQSVAAAIQSAGARYVAAVPIGRMISPTFGESRTYLDSHPLGAFDPSICPISGLPHKPSSFGATT